MSEDIRIRVAGIFIRDGKLLLVKHHKFDKEYYLLPGGGQEKGESARQALEREMLEELSLKVKVSDFLFAGESIPPKDLPRKQVLQLVFRIEEADGDLKLVPDGPLVDYYWASFEELPGLTIYPLCLLQIQDAITGKTAKPYVSYPWAD